MHTGTLKKLALALTFWLALHTSLLKAQLLPYHETATGVDFEFRLDGSIVEEGAGATSTLSDADLESSSRFIWYPTLSALRAGVGYPSETVSNIGANSVALGIYSTASGYASIALGGYTSASGYFSTALGKGTSASGRYSTALGRNTSASGYYSTAMGSNTTASGYFSTAMGYGTIANGKISTAMGFETSASGTYSMASGVFSSASGFGSTALGVSMANGYFSTSFGSNTTASGTSSTASGYHTSASAYESFVIGQFNVGGGTGDSWVPTDPLFEIGNGPGTGDTPNSDALVVYKNGNAILQGTLQVAPGGDIPMYTGE